MDVTIVICTHNRDESLRQTMEALGRTRVPEHLRCELLLVDNASTDRTAEVIHSFNFANLPIRYHYEPRQGMCYARNTAIAVSRGRMLLFTDDDVRPPHEWIEEMCAPILARRAEAVAGGVKIAPSLERPWMSRLHRIWLASTQGIDPEKPGRMTGANMAFSKKILKRVTGFDTELGPGGLGTHDETLFSFQIIEAGFRIIARLDIEAEHHFEPARLSRSSFLDAARKLGESSAYIAYHWAHDEVRLPRLKPLLWRLELAKSRQRRRAECRKAEGIPEWEMHAVWSYHLYRHHLVERKRPRNYTRRGLVKLNHEPSADPDFGCPRYDDLVPSVRQTPDGV